MSLSKCCLFIGLFFITFSTKAQLYGLVTDESDVALPFVNIYIEGSNRGTTTNGDGVYNLPLEKADLDTEVTIVFKYLGYTTKTQKIVIDDLKVLLDAQLVASTTSLDEVIVQAGVNPADRIIKATIAARKKNLERLSEYKAKFYSKGVWKVEDAPEKILGQEIGDLGGGLDSTRTGIVYLSETISNIAYQRPDNFSEEIVASKISGNDNGFSFNTAVDANFSFYENTLDLNAQIISPIASNAYVYYKYKLEGTFYEEGKLINKVKVIPRRENDRIFSGIIYIVEDDWQLYGVDLNTNGTAIQVPIIESLNFKQNFKYEKSIDKWVKRSQVIDFSFSFFGVKGDGSFVAGYSEYDFNPDFTKKSFSNEILSFQEDANKKDSTFWQKVRPVPLTQVEVEDYTKKDSLQVIRKSKKHLDSIDARGNKFKILDPFFGYSYRDTYNKKSFSVSGPLQDISFNTVQGWNGSITARYTTWSDENFTSSFSAFAKADYGFSEDRLRYTGGFSKRFNRTNRASLQVSGGVDILQFNNTAPIKPLVNSIYTLGLEENFAKYYEKVFAEAYYGQEVINGFRLDAVVAYEERNPVFNTTDQTFFPKDDKEFTSNNPLAPFDEGSTAFESHSIGKLIVSGRINFGQKYYSYPDGKFNVNVDKYPSLTLVYEKGFGASVADYDFDQLRLIVQQEFNVGNKGRLKYDARVGTFLGTAKDISFVDRQHFNVNQTIIFDPENSNRFYNLPYYERSTNEAYFEGHAEHNFRGWILGKIPLINKLNFNLIAGAHILSTQDASLYREFSIGLDNVGFGKYRFLRLDYVHSQGAIGGSDNAFLIGVSF